MTKDQAVIGTRVRSEKTLETGRIIVTTWGCAVCVALTLPRENMNENTLDKMVCRWFDMTTLEII